MFTFNRLPERMRNLPSAGEALPGRDTPLLLDARHEIFGCSLLPPYPVDCDSIVFGLGCFWGAERLFWQLSGVRVTAVGYAAGHTPNPTYEEVCSGLTGHAEVVRVVFDPLAITLETLLKTFWEAHDPTQGMRQGNDIGTQYRSLILCNDSSQQRRAEASREAFQNALIAEGHGRITTDIAQSGAFYFAEPYHQQYLYKHPDGYCGLRGTGVACGTF